MSTDYSEDTLVEHPTIELFAELEYETANCFYEKVGSSGSTLGRETTAEVILVLKLRSALQKLNPDLNSDAINLAIEALARDRSAMSLVQANREVYKLLKDGVKVSFQNDEGEETDETVRVIDWNNPGNNDFFLASQLWVSGSVYKRRADLVGFVNGLPLIFIELKKSHGKIEHAYKHNLKDYKKTVPQLFWYNALIILSNGDRASSPRYFLLLKSLLNALPLAGKGASSNCCRLATSKGTLSCNWAATSPSSVEISFMNLASPKRAGPGSCSGKVNNSTRLRVRPFGVEPEVPPVPTMLPSPGDTATSHGPKAFHPIHNPRDFVEKRARGKWGSGVPSAPTFSAPCLLLFSTKIVHVANKKSAIDHHCRLSQVLDGTH